MRSVLIEWLGRHLDDPSWIAFALTQPVLLVVAAIVATLLLLREARARQLPLALALGGLLAAMTGGALFGHWVDLAFHPDSVVRDPTIVFQITRGGYSSLGTYFGALVGLRLWCRWTGRDFLATLDLHAPAALVAAGIARSSCLFAGCDFGRIAPESWYTLRYPRGTAAFRWLEKRGLVGDYQQVGLPMHAFPVYELLPILVAGTLLALRPDWMRDRPGLRAATAGFVYCATRAVAESFRGDAPTATAGVSTLQLLCTLGALLFAALAWQIAHRPAPNP